ncbi:MAG TPA: hypothetical protein VIM53_01710 [Candidatus Saccharimonadales bacterium]
MTTIEYASNPGVVYGARVTRHEARSQGVLRRIAAIPGVCDIAKLAESPRLGRPLPRVGLLLRTTFAPQTLGLEFRYGEDLNLRTVGDTAVVGSTHSVSWSAWLGPDGSGEWLEPGGGHDIGDPKRTLLYVASRGSSAAGRVTLRPAQLNQVDREGKFTSAHVIPFGPPQGSETCGQVLEELAKRAGPGNEEIRAAFTATVLGAVAGL